MYIPQAGERVLVTQLSVDDLVTFVERVSAGGEIWWVFRDLEARLFRGDTPIPITERVTRIYMKERDITRIVPMS